MQESIYFSLYTLYLQGKAGNEPLSRAAVYVPFYSNKVKDKPKKQVNHTYKLIEAKVFYDNDKMKRRKDKQHQVITSRELLPCVPFCLLSS